MGARVHVLLRTLHCVECEACYFPMDIIGHMKSHGIYVSKDDVEVLLARYQLHTELKDVKLPYPGGPPVEFLKMLLGYRCRYCSHACPKEHSLKNHIRDKHPNRSPVWAECMIPGVSIQTLFSSVGHKYFVVNPTLIEVPEEDIYTTIIRDYLPSQPSLPVRPEPTLRDIEPLLQVTEWHIRMHDYMDDLSRRNLLLKLKAEPTPDEPGYCNIAEATLSYLKDARSKELNLTARKIVMQGPNIAQTNGYALFI